MRLARPIALTAAALALAACSAATPGWTYAPAPSKTPIPSAAASGSVTPSTAPSVAPSAGASGEPSTAPGGTVLQLSAQNVQFDTTTLTAPANTPFQIEFSNNDQGIPHNVAIKDSAAQDVFNGAIFNGVDKQTYDVPALAAGTYKFVCSVHPTMTGELTVQ